MSKKSFHVFVLTLACLSAAFSLRAQFASQSIAVTESAEPVAEVAADSIVQLTAEAQGLPPVAREKLPPTGTFWEMTPGGFMLPLPCPPFDETEPVYQIADGIFLADGTGGKIVLPKKSGDTVESMLEAQAQAVVDLIGNVETTAFNRAFALEFLETESEEGFTSNARGIYNPGGPELPDVDYGTNLWIARPAVTNHFLTGIGSNTLADVQYEIQSRTNLLQLDWQSEGFILGSALTNWTPLSVAQNNRTNLFLRLRSWLDSSNVGIPDWWQLQYFGYIGINPYGNPSGDGYSNFYKYQQGLNPTNFLTPPAPGNFVAMLSTNGTNVLLTWDPAQGTLLHYTLVRAALNTTTYHYDYSTIAVLGPNTNSFLHKGAIRNANDFDNFYLLTADYSSNRFSYTAYTYIYSAANPPPSPPPAAAYNISVSAILTRNVIGRWQLMFFSLPATAQSIRLTWANTNGVQTAQNISASILTNGIYQVPDTTALNFLGGTVSVQGVGAGGETGALSLAGTLANDAPCFVDGRQHLKQNLLFALRAATVSQPNVLPHYNDFSYVHADSNYVESSFFHLETGITDIICKPYLKMDALWPFTANYQFHQNLNDPSYNGATNFVWQGNLVSIPAAAVLNLGNSSPYWIATPFIFNKQYCVPVQINPQTGLPLNSYLTNRFAEVSTYTNGGTLYFQNGGLNQFGLSFQTALVIGTQNYNYQTGLPLARSTNTLAPGGNIALTNAAVFYAQTASPNLQLADYYFATVNTSGTDASGNFGRIQAHPTPATVSFASTNQTGVLIASVGQPTVVAGWAKFGIQNGYTNKFAYLGQYFVTNAFLLDANSNVTTNSAGVLSPYGDFFPTQVGKAKLVTMPDIDSGLQATCTVSIVSLNVDANHDGTMDLSYFGQDQTSPSKPYVFWCNNDFDRLFHDAADSADYEDGVETGFCPNTPYTKTFDADYSDANGNRVIPTKRDLEDFSRLWLTGVTTNLLTNLPAGGTITLSWKNISDGNPTIDLFRAADADGGIGYLTNSTVAAQQTNTALSPYLGRLAPGGSITLKYPYVPLSVYWPGNYFVWCGATKGTGQLVLSFKDGNGNLLGQASVWIQLNDIKQMYERWTVGDNLSQDPAVTAYLAQDNLAPGTSAFQYGPAATNTSYILFVHGWNMKIADKNIFAETAFKRLWWQGYQGRFGSFRWPTGCDFTGGLWALATQHRNFDDSEFKAWKSGAGLKNMVTRLNILYTNNVYLMAHSMGNVVAGEALKLAGNNQLVNTYVAMQGAVPSHAYDANTPTRSLGIGGLADSGTPNRYANYFTNGAPCYFNNSAGAGTYVNFFNTNDFALDAWQTDQNLKPDNGWNYNAGTGQFEVYSFGWHPLNFPTNTYEIFAYCDEARCYALGAQKDVGGAFQKNGTSQQIDLFATPYGFGGQHLYHSLQFRSDNTRSIFFWNRMLVKFGLKEE